MFSDNGGYYKFPNGLIIQWGQVTSLISEFGVGTHISYPTNFPNKVLSVQATLEDTQRTNRSLTEINIGDTNTVLNTINITTTSFIVYTDFVLPTEKGFTPLDYCNVHWFAIGY